MLEDIVGKIIEISPSKYKVWVSGPGSAGCLRIGHVWKTKQGAHRAMLEHLQKYNMRGYIGLARNENDSEIGE